MGTFQEPKLHRPTAPRLPILPVECSKNIISRHTAKLLANFASPLPRNWPSGRLTGYPEVNGGLIFNVSVEFPTVPTVLVTCHLSTAISGATPSFGGPTAESRQTHC